MQKSETISVARLLTRCYFAGKTCCEVGRKFSKAYFREEDYSSSLDAPCTISPRVAEFNTFLPKVNAKDFYSSLEKVTLYHTPLSGRMITDRSVTESVLSSDCEL